VDDPRYKVKPCREWDERGGQCPRGVRCDFGHGPIELRVLGALRAGAGGGTVGGAAAAAALSALSTAAAARVAARAPGGARAR